MDHLFPQGLCAWPKDASLGSLSQWEGFRGSGCSTAWPWGGVTAGCAGEGGAGGLGSPWSKGEWWGKPKEMRGGWSDREARAEGSPSLLAPQRRVLSLPRAQERRQPRHHGPSPPVTEPRLGHGSVLRVTAGLKSPLLHGADDDRPTIVSRMTQVAGMSPPRVTPGALSMPWVAVTDDHRWGGVFSQLWRPGPNTRASRALGTSEAPGRVCCLTLLTTVPGDWSVMTFWKSVLTQGFSGESALGCELQARGLPSALFTTGQQGPVHG